MKYLIFGALCLLAIPTQARALTGTELYSLCNSADGSSANVSCTAYIRGLMDGMYLADDMAAHGNRYCPPDNFALPQARLIVEKYMRMTPAMAAGVSNRLWSIEELVERTSN
jgi:hypothetical protein